MGDQAVNTAEYYGEQAPEATPLTPSAYVIVEAARMDRGKVLIARISREEMSILEDNNKKSIEAFLKLCKGTPPTIDEAMAYIEYNGHLYGRYKGSEVRMLPARLGLNLKGVPTHPRPKLMLTLGNQDELKELRGLMIDLKGGLSID